MHDNIEHEKLLQASGDVIQKNTITELALLSRVQQLELPYNTKQLRLQVKMFALENAKEIEKLSKNYLHTKGKTFAQYVSNIYTENFHIDELFLVIVSRRYKTHICVVLNNGGTWSTTPCIKQCDYKLCFMCCGNGKEMSYTYYVPTAGNQVPSGVDEMQQGKLNILIHLCMSRNWPTLCQRVKTVRVFLSQRKGS